MKISEALNKSNPVVQKREMSMTEYAKLVDANTELVDQLKDYKARITKAIEYIEGITKIEMRSFDYNGFMEKHAINYNYLKKLVEKEQLEGHFVSIEKDIMLSILKGEDYE